MFSKLRILLFVCFRSTHGWMGMDVSVNIFTISLQYHSCAQTLVRGERCLGPDLQ